MALRLVLILAMLAAAFALRVPAICCATPSAALHLQPACTDSTCCAAATTQPLPPHHAPSACCPAPVHATSPTADAPSAIASAGWIRVCATCPTNCDACKCCRRAPRLPMQPAGQSADPVRLAWEAAGPPATIDMPDPTPQWRRVPAIPSATPIRPPDAAVRRARLCVWTT